MWYKAWQVSSQGLFLVNNLDKKNNKYKIHSLGHRKKWIVIVIERHPYWPKMVAKSNQKTFHTNIHKW
jgi:hypothetical protein